MVYTTDTHALVWYFTSDEKLGRDAFSIFEKKSQSDTIYIPIIVLAEIMYITEKGRINLSFDETMKMILENPKYEVLLLDLDILTEAAHLKMNLEMHDRLIVASALNSNSILITKDSQIIETKLVQTVW